VSDEKKVDAKGYWAATIRLTLSLLAIWFVVSFGAGILFRDVLDQVSIGGAPLGFWFAQQGSIYVFVALIFYYCRAMARLERKYGVED
jgi:putative solute:sodium symporter small subunit